AAGAPVPRERGAERGPRPGRDRERSFFTREVREMKVDGNSKTSGSGGAAVQTEQKKPRRPFSEVLKQPPDGAGTAPFAPPPPLVEPAPVSSGRSVAPGSDAMLSSLVREISVHVPPGGAASVDIQFDSRTLQGLHVRVQKSDRGVEVRLST